MFPKVEGSIGRFKNSSIRVRYMEVSSHVCRDIATSFIPLSLNHTSSQALHEPAVSTHTRARQHNVLSTKDWDDRAPIFKHGNPNSLWIIHAPRSEKVPRQNDPIQPKLRAPPKLAMSSHHRRCADLRRNPGAAVPGHFPVGKAAFSYERGRGKLAAVDSHCRFAGKPA